MNAVYRYAAQLRSRTAVRAVYLCGSWAKGNYSPYSDVDLLIVVDRDDRALHERVPDYLPDSFPRGLDLFVYTEQELRDSPFARELLRGSVPV